MISQLHEGWRPILSLNMIIFALELLIAEPSLKDMELLLGDE
jgi:ubiquitin-protein ligase